MEEEKCLKSRVLGLYLIEKCRRDASLGLESWVDELLQSVVLSRLNYYDHLQGGPKKPHTILLSIYLLSISLLKLLIDFHNSFTDVLSWKFAIKLLIKISSHLRCAATLPCKMLMFANRCIPSSH